MFDPTMGMIVIVSLVLLKLGTMLNAWLERREMNRKREDGDE
jgi:ABC-type protease/lipase transport system fused ATPase/permease subunit